MNWSDPTTPADFQPDADWLDALVPLYAHLMAWTGQALDDGMFHERWRSAVTLFDAGPEPRTPEDANARWRELVGAVWIALVAYEQRQQRAQAAAFLRRLAGGVA